MNYTEVICVLGAAADAADITVALLAELGFDSFEESGNSVKAYIPTEKFDAAALSELVEEYPQLIVSTDAHRMEPVNWNRVWESNFPMTEIAGRVAVYAPFHVDVPASEYRICILPQMSFGTGHHETTSLMIEMMLDLDTSGKRVLDMGCGTGILAIFAAMKKAHPITAIDIDEWAYRNAAENCARNGVGIGDGTIEILQGDSRLLAGRGFDVVLANINRNILLEDMAAYAKCLPSGGWLQVSGFYASDLSDMTTEAQRCGLRFVRRLEKKDWAAALYRKV